MIGERLRLLRKDRGMTQKELAGMIGVTKSTVSQYETDSNEPCDEIKIRIARYFNISADYLIGLIDSEITYYNEDYFWKIPEGMPGEERELIRDFIEFIDYRKYKK